MDYGTACACFLVFLVVVAGVASPVGVDSPDETAEDSATADEIGRNTFSGTLVVNSTSVRFNSTTVARVWANRSSGAYRIEFLEPENVTWDVVVSNGSRVWAYDRDENQVVTTTAVHGHIADELTDLVRPFYFDDFFYSSGDLAERLDRYHVRSLGRQTIAGRETFVLQIRRTAPATYVAPETTTLWLDANRSFPVRMESVSRGGFGGDFHQTRFYRNLSFGEPIDPDRFTFDPPADANVSRPGEVRPTYVPEPKLPPDFQRVGSGMGGAATYENGTEKYYRRTLTVDYANLTTTIVVENHTRPRPRENFTVGEGAETIRANLRDKYPFPANDSVTTVDIVGVAGAAWTVNETAYAAWPCNGSYFLVHSSLPESAVVEVARTMPCGGEAGSNSISTALARPTGESAVGPDPMDANATRIAPGVTTAGIVYPARLLAAHHESVAAGDFVAVLTETRTVRRGNRTATVEFGQRFAYDAASGTYLATYQNESARDRNSTVVWGNETTQVTRTAAYGHHFYEPSVAPTSSVPTGSSSLFAILASYDFAVRDVTELADPNRTRLRLDAEESGVEATLVLDSTGHIYEFTMSRLRTSEAGEANETSEASKTDQASKVSGASKANSRIRSVEYRLHTERDVPRLDPAWVADAPRDAAFRVQMGMEVESNYVYLSHEYGETVPAGTVVELRTANRTYETRLGSPLEPREDRQLFVLDGTLSVTTDHLAAKRLGENLSSPVELLLYTDGGVLVYHETFRWSAGEILSIASGVGRTPSTQDRPARQLRLAAWERPAKQFRLAAWERPAARESEERYSVVLSRS